MLDGGMSPRQIALALHITTQAVYKHKKALAAPVVTGKQQKKATA